MWLRKLNMLLNSTILKPQQTLWSVKHECIFGDIIYVNKIELGVQHQLWHNAIWNDACLNISTQKTMALPLVTKRKNLDSLEVTS